MKTKMRIQDNKSGKRDINKMWMIKSGHKSGTGPGWQREADT